MSKGRTIVASFKENNDGFNFYEVVDVYNNNNSYVLRKQGTNDYYLFIRSLYVLVDLKTTFKPADEEVLASITHMCNTVDSNCLMFYADSNFVKYSGIWDDDDLISLKQRCLKIKSAMAQAKATLQGIKEHSYYHYIINWFKYVWVVKRQNAKLKRRLKEFKILW